MFLFAAERDVQRNAMRRSASKPSAWFLFAAERDVQRNWWRHEGGSGVSRFYSLLSGTCSATRDMWLGGNGVVFLFAAERNVQRNPKLRWRLVEAVRFLFAAERDVQRNEKIV